MGNGLVGVMVGADVLVYGVEQCRVDFTLRSVNPEEGGNQPEVAGHHADMIDQ
jgi:hypothetical protein